MRSVMANLTRYRGLGRTIELEYLNNLNATNSYNNNRKNNENNCITRFYIKTTSETLQKLDNLYLARNFAR